MTSAPEYNPEARIISPHADDAALSLAGHIAQHYQNARVLTVFTRSGSHILEGVGENPLVISAIRTEEDENFCAEMGWQLSQGDLPDSEVRGISWDDTKAPVDQQLVERVAELITEFTRGTGYDLYIPAAVGLHPDHYAVVRAIGTIIRQVATPMYIYADIPYALVKQPLMHHGNSNLKEPDAMTSNPHLKDAALRFYPSQISPERLEWVASNDREMVWHVGEDYFTAARLRGEEGRTTFFDQTVWSEGIAQAYQDANTWHLDINAEQGSEAAIPVTLQRFNLPNGDTFTALRLRASLATDYSRTPTRPELELLRQVARQNGADVIWLSNMPEDTISDQLFGEISAPHESFTNNATTGIVCALSFDQWLAELSRNTRRVLKRKDAKIAEYAQGQGLELRHGYKQLNRQLLEQFLEMQKRRAQSHAALDALQDNQQFADLLRIVADAGTLQVSTLHVGNVAVAMSLVHFDQMTKTVSVLAQAFEPDWHEYSPGIVNMTRIIRDAHEHQYAYIDLLRGDEGYKTHIINTTRRLVKYIEQVATITAGDFSTIKDYIKSYEE